jgi:hypothetical protein
VSNVQVRAGQVLIAEAALIAAAVAATGPAWVLVGVSAAVAAVLLALFGRTGGRWWYQAAAAYPVFTRRRRQVAADVVAATIGARAPQRLIWLRTLAAELAVSSETVAGTTVGVGSDAAGWFAVLAVSGDRRPLLGLGADMAGVSCVQAVLPPEPRAWVSLRLSPVDAVRLGGAAPSTVAAAALRMQRILRHEGSTVRVLEPGDLLAELTSAIGLDGPPQEFWSNWCSGTLTHTTYAALHWPAGVAPPTWATVSICRAAAGTGMLLRISQRQPRGLNLAGWAASTGVRLRRLDGEQAPAVYASAPTAMPAAFDRALGSEPFLVREDDLR